MMYTVFMVLLLINISQGRWMTKYDESIDFQCPTGEYIYSLKSKHSSYYGDRVHDIKCRKGLVGDECSWSANANVLDGAMNFFCPDNHILTGAKSKHDNHAEDRVWRFKCCKTVVRGATDCHSTGNINKYDDLATYTVPNGQAITGISSQHSNRYEDRVGSYTVCRFERCKGKGKAIKVEVLGDMKSLIQPPKFTGDHRVLGMVTSQGCTEDRKYTLEPPSHTASITETQSFTITNSDKFSFGTSVQLDMGNGPVYMGVSQSTGSSITAARSYTKDSSSTETNDAGGKIQLIGPAAGLIMAVAKEFTVEAKDLTVAVHVRCDDGSSSIEKTKINYSSKTYGRTYFKRMIVIFKPGKCSSQSNECLRRIKGPTGLRDTVASFMACFDGIGNRVIVNI